LLQANPGKQTKFGELLNTVVGASNYKLFVKRLVDQHLQALDTPGKPIFLAETTQN